MCVVINTHAHERFKNILSPVEISVQRRVPAGASSGVSIAIAYLAIRLLMYSSLVISFTSEFWSVTLSPVRASVRLTPPPI